MRPQVMNKGGGLCDDATCRGTCFGQLRVRGGGGGVEGLGM